MCLWVSKQESKLTNDTGAGEIATLQFCVILFKGIPDFVIVYNLVEQVWRC